MAGFNGLKSAFVVAAALAIPVLTNGCSSNASNPLCCTEFEVGATVNADIGGSAQSQIAVQAVADIGGIASAAIDDLLGACQSMAQDLGAAQADQQAADATADKNGRMKAWCQLAVKQIGAVKGSATLNIAFQPPACQASVNAKLDCQAKCSGTASCDFKANPPKCTGGSLTVDCKGDCTASAGATVSCTGSCTGNCSGSCTAQGGVAVDCQGKCDGTCSAGGTAGGNGIQADGTCKGQCQGTCTASATAPAVKCTGSCNGKCDADCKGSATASVKCDGSCSGDYQPISCSGGKLEGGCQVDAKCDANCDGSVQAKATCTPPAVTVEFTGTIDANLGAKLKATLEANLPNILVLRTRFSAIATATGTLTANIGAVTDIKAACIPAVVAAAGTAVGDISDSVSTVGSLTGSVGI